MGKMGLSGKEMPQFLPVQDNHCGAVGRYETVKAGS
jgi:hypothetical protein